MTIPPESFEDPAGSGWLETLPRGLAEGLIARAKTRRVPLGNIVYSLGDEPRGIYGVASGIVASGRGRAVVYQLMSRGCWFGEAGALSGASSAEAVWAVTDCSLFTVSTSNLNELAAEFPDTWRVLGALASARHQQATRRVHDLTIRDPHVRSAAVLRGFRSDIGPAPQALPLTQEQLARACLVSRGTFSRVLAQFERAGKVERRYGRTLVRI